MALIACVIDWENQVDLQIHFINGYTSTTTLFSHGQSSYRWPKPVPHLMVGVRVSLTGDMADDQPHMSKTWFS